MTNLPNITNIKPIKSEAKPPELNLPETEAPKPKKKTVSKKQSEECQKLNEIIFQDRCKKALQFELGNWAGKNPMTPKQLKAIKAGILRRTVKPDHHENASGAIEQCIQVYINRIAGCTAWKVDVKGTKRKVKGKKEEVWTKTTSTSGVSDIHALIRGRYLAVEVKFGKDVQSDDQKEFEANVNKAGGTYFLAKSYTHFRQVFLNLWGEWNQAT